MAIWIHLVRKREEEGKEGVLAFRAVEKLAYRNKRLGVLFNYAMNRSDEQTENL